MWVLWILLAAAVLSGIGYLVYLSDQADQQKRLKFERLQQTLTDKIAETHEIVASQIKLHPEHQKDAIKLLVEAAKHLSASPDWTGSQNAISIETKEQWCQEGFTLVDQAKHLVDICLADHKNARLIESGDPQ